MRLAFALGAVLAWAIPSASASEAGAGGEPSRRVPVTAATEPARLDDAGAKAPTPAKQAAKVEVLVLHATSGGKGIDPKLGDMPELKKPPFSSYDSYKLLDQAELSLEQGKATGKALPDKGKLTLTLKEIVPAQKKGDLDKYVLNASIAKPEDKPFLPSLDVSAHAKERLFIAGQKYDGGILVIVLRVL